MRSGLCTLEHCVKQVLKFSALVVLASRELAHHVLGGLIAASVWVSSAKKVASGSPAKRIWLNVTLPWIKNRRCPHCGFALELEQESPLCPQCYGDLQQPCPECGEPVGVHRRVCNHCRADLRVPRQPASGRKRSL